jgi:FdhD protein
MMATPQDLEDFAVGFSLDRRSCSNCFGDRVALEVRADRRRYRAENRGSLRQMQIARSASAAGILPDLPVVGCAALTRSIEATRPATIVGVGRNFSPAQIMSAMQSLAPLQKLNTETRAVHAAAFWLPEQGIVSPARRCRTSQRARQAGWLAGAARHGCRRGFVLLTSRVSVEMIQKSAMIGAPMVVAVSAPTTLAVEMAQAAAITLVGIARHDGFEVFTHSNRISDRTSPHEVTAHVV